MRVRYQGPAGEVLLELTRDGDFWVADVDGRKHRVRRVAGPPGSVVLVTDDDRVTPFWPGDRRITSDGQSWTMTRASRSRGGQVGAQGSGLEAPMPGTVLQVRVELGDEVEADQVLLVIEAMKMEHAIRAPRAGKVVRLPFVEGDRISAGDPLAELE